MGTGAVRAIRAGFGEVMNVREGMRRLGILLGVSGGILGGCLAYSDAKAAWDSHAAYRAFESRMASSTMQKVAKAARDYQNGPWVKYRSKEPSGPVNFEPNGTIWETVPSDSSPPEKAKAPPTRSKFGGIPVEEDPGSGRKPDVWEKAAKNEDWKLWKRDTEAPAALPRDFFDKPGAILVSVGLDGIKQVAVDRAGLVFSIETSNGTWVDRTDAPALRAYLIPLLYPILGFLLPWGGIRILTWVGSGFDEPRR